MSAPEDTSAHRAGEWVVKLQRGLKQIKHNPLPPHTHTHTSSLTANTGLCLDIPERGAKLPLFSLFLCTHKTSTIYFSCYVTWWHLLAPQAPRLCLFFRLGWHRGHMPAYGPLAPRYWSLSQEQGSEVSCPQKQYTQLRSDRTDRGERHIQRRHKKTQMPQLMNENQTVTIHFNVLVNEVAKMWVGFFEEIFRVK